MIRPLPIALLFLFFFGLPEILISQRLTGTLIDSSLKVPLEGWRVSIPNYDSDYTNSSGEFSIDLARCSHCTYGEELPVNITYTSFPLIQKRVLLSPSGTVVIEVSTKELLLRSNNNSSNVKRAIPTTNLTYLDTITISQMIKFQVKMCQGEVYTTKDYSCLEDIFKEAALGVVKSKLRSHINLMEESQAFKKYVGEVSFSYEDFKIEELFQLEENVCFVAIKYKEILKANSKYSPFDNIVTGPKIAKRTMYYLKKNDDRWWIVSYITTRDDD